MTRSTGRRWAALSIGLLAAIATVTAASAQDAITEPAVTVDRPSADFGDELIVAGIDWPANAFVHVEICGNQGARATLDCDQVTAQQSGVSSSGTFGVVLLVGNPPSPCPCVVRVSSISTETTVLTPLDIRGAPVASGDPTPLELPERLLLVTDVETAGPTGWRSWLGLAGEQTVTVTVKNVGRALFEDPLLQLRFGPGGDPGQQMLQRPGLGTIAPGESATFEVVVKTPFAVIGTHTVEGRFQGVDDPAFFRTETVHLPWLLMAIPVVVAIGAAMALVRRRAHRTLRSQLAALAPQPPFEPGEPDTVQTTTAPVERAEPETRVPARVAEPVPTPRAEPETRVPARVAEPVPVAAPDPEATAPRSPDRTHHPASLATLLPEPPPVTIDLTMPELVPSDLDALVDHQVGQARTRLHHPGTVLRHERERRAMSAELTAAAITRVASTMGMDSASRARLTAQVGEKLRSERPLTKR